MFCRACLNGSFSCAGGTPTSCFAAGPSPPLPTPILTTVPPLAPRAPVACLPFLRRRYDATRCDDTMMRRTQGPILCLAAFESRACAGSTDGTVRGRRIL